MQTETSYMHFGAYVFNETVLIQYLNKVDHNVLLMDIMNRIADKHQFKVLLHLKLHKPLLAVQK